MNFNCIVAMTHNGLIGKDGTIPWNVPEDLQHFKETTLHSIVVMGRKTFDSLPKGPLKNRINVVITRQPNLISSQENVIFTTMENINDVLQTLINKQEQEQKIFIIGGSQIYNHFFRVCKTFYITVIWDFLEPMKGDCFFPHDFEYMQTHFIMESNSELLVSKNKTIYQLFTFSSHKTS